MLSRDGIAGLICLGLSIALLVMSRGLPQSALVPIGPGFYPKIVLGIMAALSVMLIAADVWSRRRSRGAVAAPAPTTPTAPEERNYRLVTVTFAVFAVYVLLLPWLGFRVATFLFVAALPVVLEKPQGWRRWMVVITAALATVIVTYLAFEVYLSVLLPRGRWTGF
jgi:putative tricarboxylic transport membrane protein